MNHNNKKTYNEDIASVTFTPLKKGKSKLDLRFQLGIGYDHISLSENTEMAVHLNLDFGLATSAQIPENTIYYNGSYHNYKTSDIHYFNAAVGVTFFYNL